MATYKRVDGDYVITTINVGDTVTIDTANVAITGNLDVAAAVSFGSISVPGNISVGNLQVTGNGIVNGDFTIIGNLQATGNVEVDSLRNGSTGINIPLPNGNINIDINGVGNSFVFSNAGIQVTGAIVANGNINGASLYSTGLASITGNISAANASFAGAGAFTGNVTAANIATTGNIVAVGNVTGNYIIGDGSFLTNITAFSNIAVSRIANTTTVLGIIDAGGPISALVGGVANVFYISSTGANVAGTFNSTGNLNAANITATGNVAGTYILGNGALLTGVITSVSSISNGTTNMSVVSSGGNIVGNIAGSTVLVLSSAGANVTGTLNATGNANVGNLDTAGLITATGNISTTGNISANYFLGNGSQLSGIDATSIQSGTSNVKVVSSGGNITASVGGTANVAIITTTGANITGTLNATGNANVGNLGATNIVGTLTTAAQTNITSLGTLTSLSILGNVTQTGNLNITGNINATGNLNYQNVTDLVVGDPLIYLGANNTGNLDDLGFIVNWDDGLYQHGGFVRNHLNGVWGVFGNVVAEPTTVVDWGNAIFQPFQSGSATFAGANINGALTGATTGAFSGNVSAGNISTGGILSVTGNITGGNLSVSTGTITGGNIVNSNANGVGNIGSSTTYFNTVFANATSAQYADLAEIYLADKDYAPGTVLRFGGEYEVTECETYHDHRVAGVVSTNPAHLMNAGHQGAFPVKLALVGRVPCRVRGPVTAGDILVSAGQGWAKANNQAQAGRIIGKSLVSADSDGLVEIVVGKH
jgi:hypothetical protein